MTQSGKRVSNGNQSQHVAPVVDQSRPSTSRQSLSRSPKQTFSFQTIDPIKTGTNQSESRSSRTRQSESGPSAVNESELRLSTNRQSELRTSAVNESELRLSTNRQSELRTSTVNESELRPSATRQSESRPSEGRHSELAETLQSEYEPTIAGQSEELSRRLSNRSDQVQGMKSSIRSANGSSAKGKVRWDDKEVIDEEDDEYEESG